MQEQLESLVEFINSGKGHAAQKNAQLAEATTCPPTLGKKIKKMIFLLNSSYASFHNRDVVSVRSLCQLFRQAIITYNVQ